MWLQRQLSMKINMPKSSPTTQKCGRGNLQEYQGHLGDTLWIYINGSRMVDLGFNMKIATQKCGRGNLTQKILNYLVSTWETVEYEYVVAECSPN